MNTKPRRGQTRSTAARGFNRRELIALGSACALTPLLERVAGAAELTGSTAIAAGAAPVSVGYLLGSDTLEDLRAFPRLGGRPVGPEGGGVSEPWLVIPAREITTSVATTRVKAATLSVLGLYPAAADGVVAGLGRVWLDVMVPSPILSAPDPLRFHAWTYSAAQPGSGRTPVRFRVPVDARLGLTMSLEAHWSASQGATGSPQDGSYPEAQANAFGPTVTLRQAVLKKTDVRLQRGVYLLGFGSTQWTRRLALPAEPQPWRTDLTSLVIAIEPVETASAK